MEGQRAAQAQAQQENAVLSKVEKIRIDQGRRADALEAEAKMEENKVSTDQMLHLLKISAECEKVCTSCLACAETIVLPYVSLKNTILYNSPLDIMERVLRLKSKVRHKL